MKDCGIRLIEETNQLRERVNKLHEFMKTKTFYELDRVEKDLLYAQFKTMLDYLQILGKRLDIKNLKLEYVDE